MSKAPYFPLYVADWLSAPEITIMTGAQEGAYIRLLCLSWKLKAVLPYSAEQLLQFVKLSTIEELEPVLKMFVKTNEGYVNTRLQEEYAKMIAKSNKASKSAKVRWGNANAMRTHDKNNANAMRTECYSDTDTDTYSNTDTKKKRTIVQPNPLERKCEEIYRAYPRRVGKKKALASIKSALKEKDFAFLLERVQTFARAVDGQEEKWIPLPTTWFNQGRYDDDEAMWSVWNKPSETPWEKKAREDKEQSMREYEEDLAAKGLKREDIDGL